MSANPGGGDYVPETVSVDLRHDYDHLMNCIDCGHGHVGREDQKYATPCPARVMAEDILRDHAVEGAAEAALAQHDHPDYVPETDAGNMDNQGTELDRLRAQVERVEALAEHWEGLADTFDDTNPKEARLTGLSASELRAALEGPLGATEPAAGTPGGSGASEGRREAHSDDVERLRRGLYPLATLTPQHASAMAEDIGASEDSLFVDWINRGKEVARLRAQLAERDTLRHQLDPTRDSGGAS